MSRAYRGRVFASRWGKASLRAKPLKHSKEEQVALVNRVIKRANAAAGYNVNKLPYKWYWGPGDTTLENAKMVVAHSRSEARARIKECLGLSKNKRLPQNITILRGDRCEENI